MWAAISRGAEEQTGPHDHDGTGSDAAQHPGGHGGGRHVRGVSRGEHADHGASALALSLGIAIQNFPEGAIISMPLRAEGVRKGKAFGGGVLSGAVEPIARC